MTTLPFTSATAGQVLWWNVLIGGIFAIVIGVLLLAAPVQTMVLLVQLLGLYWLVIGVLALTSIFVDPANWGWKLLAGMLGVLAGLAVIQHPLWSAVIVPTTLVVLLGIQGIIIGLVKIGMAFAGGGLGMAVLGVVSIVFGALLLGAPLLAAAVLPVVLGIWGIVGGAAAVFQAVRERPAAPAAGAPGTTRQAA